MDELKLENIINQLKGLKKYEWNKISQCVEIYFSEKANKVEAGDDFTEKVVSSYKRNFIL